MNSRRFVAAALLAFFAAACSGGDEQAAPEQTPTTTSAPAVVLREPSSTQAPETTSPAPTTTAAPTADAVPESLAFASTKDIGRLFEVTGAGAVLDGPSGDLVGSLADGTLVQAAAARKAGDALMVGIVDPLDPSVPIGWIDADDLRPTTQTVLSSDPEIAAQLRQARRGPGADDVPVYSTPSKTAPVVRTLVNREIAMHGGNETIAADGSQWLDVIDVNTRGLIGWVPIDQFLILTSNSAMDSEQVDTDRRADSAITYGAPLPDGQLVAVGCNATQIAFSNSSSTGMAFVFGTALPVGIQTGDSEVWQATGGTRLFVDPGETVTMTLETDGPRTWYFAGLDATFRAASIPSTAEGLVQATDFQEFTLPGGSCVYVPPIDPLSLDIYDEPEVIEEEVVEEVESESTANESTEEVVEEAPAETTTTTTTTTTAAPAEEGSGDGA